MKDLKEKLTMSIEKLINKADKDYIRYISSCGKIAKEAQKYIDWDEISCEYVPGDGLCILATIPDSSGIYLSSPDCVCPVNSFFELTKSNETISPKEFYYKCI